MIALACLHVACVVQQKDARQWFAELSVDMEKILEIIRVILKLYEQWKNFDERKEMATILSKMPKPKPPPLLKERQKDLKFLSEEEYWKLQIFLLMLSMALGEHLKLRQQVIATATVYFKRFYARYSLKSIDPVLMALRVCFWHPK